MNLFKQFVKKLVAEFFRIPSNCIGNLRERCVFFKVNYDSNIPFPLFLSQKVEQKARRFANLIFSLCSLNPLTI